jgi:hypothetical protein
VLGEFELWLAAGVKPRVDICGIVGLADPFAGDEWVAVMMPEAALLPIVGSRTDAGEPPDAASTGEECVAVIVSKAALLPIVGSRIDA